MPRYKDLTGKTFGKWQVLSKASFIQHSEYKERTWNCKCECGVKRVVGSRLLLSRGSQSCGCSRKGHTPRKTHGLRSHRLYPTWRTMRQRCSNPNNQKYTNYGGRGIKVCERWNGFPLFLEDMEPSWKEGLTLERINVNGDYELSNCKWIPLAEQAKNRTNTVLLEYNGQCLSVKEAAELIGVSDGCIRYRLKAGWSVDQILTTGL